MANKKTKEERNIDMNLRENNVIRLHLELNIDGADMAVLKKHGKVKDGITREILVPADMNLHSLHFVIQKAFGWQNGHLHHFLLSDDLFCKLTGNNFLRWSDYCGLYFRFPTDDMEDLYWDDDYDESVSFKTWLRRKYTGIYHYNGISEHLMEAKGAVRHLINENPMLRVSPPFSEWMTMSEKERIESQTKPRVKKIEDVTCDEMREYFVDEGGLNELLERLKITEILGKEAETDKLNELIANANKRFEENDTEADNEYEYRRKMRRLDGTALPITEKLVYEYDYGDGWEVKISFVDEYDSGKAENHPVQEGSLIPAVSLEQGFDDDTFLNKNGENIEGELRDQIITVVKTRRPLCIALDGLPVLDDVGGIGGYCEMLSGIHGEGSERLGYDDSEEIKEWARMQGWTGRMNKPQTLL